MAGDPVGGAGRPALLVHGTSDTVIPLERSVASTATFAEAGWRAVLRQIDTDHAGVIGTVYDRDLRRCVPTEDRARLAVLPIVAREVARLAARNGWHTVIVVTSVYHVQRSRMVFDRCYSGRLEMVAPPTEISASRWAYEAVYQSAAFVEASLQGGC